MLQDRLDCGLRNAHILKKLLLEADVTCTSALDIAVAMETAAGDVTELQSKHSTSTSTSVYKLYTKKNTFDIVRQQENSIRGREVVFPVYGDHNPQSCYYKDKDG